MTNSVADTSLRNTVRVAGFMFLLSLFVPLLNWTLVLSRFIAAENPINTAHNILANEFLFRIGIINELITAVVVVVLAVVLYIILKPVNKNLALLALFLKLVEAILWAVIPLGLFVALLFLNGQTYLSVFEPEQIQALVGVFFNAHITVTAVAGVFCGLTLVMFSYLFFKSKYIPGIIAVFGIISYALIFIYDFLMILVPNFSPATIIQIFFWVPSCCFELIIGIWLLWKGMDFQQRDNRTLESA
jgi:hypothetical protein